VGWGGGGVGFGIARGGLALEQGDLVAGGVKRGGRLKIRIEGKWWRATKRNYNVGEEGGGGGWRGGGGDAGSRSDEVGGGACEGGEGVEGRCPGGEGGGGGRMGGVGGRGKEWVGGGVGRAVTRG